MSFYPFYPSPKNFTQKKKGYRFFPAEEVSVRIVVENLFGFWPPVELLTGLLGAISSSEIFLGTLRNGLYAEHYETEQLGLTGHCRLSHSRKGELVLLQELNILRTEKRVRGEGTTIFQRQVECCRQLGIRRIIMFGRRNRLECGYYVLPRFGFDTRLPQKIQSLLPAEFRQPPTLKALFRTAEGKNWWKRYGSTLACPLVYCVNENEKW